MNRREFRATCENGHETIVIGREITSAGIYIFGSDADFCGVCGEPIIDGGIAWLDKDQP